METPAVDCAAVVIIIKITFKAFVYMEDAVEIRFQQGFACFKGAFA